MRNNKVIKYLQGNSNNNILGTILGVQRGKHASAKIDSVALLIYLDHRTGRLERYLINNSNEQKPNEILIDNEKAHILDKEHYSFKQLNDGKLNSRFFNLFLIELVRDYFTSFHSYKICDMNYIRNYTLPNIISKTDSGEELATGSGNIVPGYVPLKGTKPFINKVWFNLDKNKPYALNIPLYMNCHANKGALEALMNIQMQEFVFDSKSPAILQDLKSAFNTKSILNLDSFNEQVIEFNKRTQSKLEKLESLS